MDALDCIYDIFDVVLFTINGTISFRAQFLHLGYLFNASAGEWLGRLMELYQGISWAKFEPNRQLILTLKNNRRPILKSIYSDRDLRPGAPR